MSKKSNNNKNTEAQSLAVNTNSSNSVKEETKMLTLKNYMEMYPNVSLRKLSKISGICYGVLLATAKKPIEGEVYDANAINWPLLEAKFEAKQIDYNQFDWLELNQTPTRSGATLEKDINAFNVGDKVYLRLDNETPFEILYKTDTHIVIMKEGTSEPQAWSHSTFFMKGPAFEPRAQKSEKTDVEA